MSPVPRPWVCRSHTVRHTYMVMASSPEGCPLSLWNSGFAIPSPTPGVGASILAIHLAGCW